MNTPADLALVLRRAGCEQLPPVARATFAGRLLEHGAVTTTDGGFNLGGLRPHHYGSAKKGLAVESFPTLEGAARALVATSYRTAPRAWGELGAAELAALDSYPIQREAPSPTLGWWPGFGPSDAAKDTYRGLVADWAVFESLGVGSKILPYLHEDLRDWRKFRDEWEGADIPGDEIGGRLTGEVLRAKRVRASLVAEKITDPQLQKLGPAQQGVDVDEAGGGVKTGDKIDKLAKGNRLLDFLTDPAQPATITLPGLPALPPRILWTIGLGLLLSLGLASRVFAR